MLPFEDFKRVVRDTPLISIDLVIADESGRVLVGRRLNDPARGFWFVPGGRVNKNESLDEAFGRLTRVEIGQELSRSSAKFLGVYEHFYDVDFTGDDSLSGTHYVVLAYQVELNSNDLSLPLDEQHDGYRWIGRSELDDTVHHNTRVYFDAI